MKGIETVDVYSHITFSALFRSVLSTVRTSALCWAVGKKVAAIVQADFFWNTLSQSLWSTRTSHSCWLGMAHEIHAYHVSSKCQQVQWSVLPRWCLAIQQPSILDRKVQRVCKQGPPPFLRPHGDAICWHILICSVNTTHSVVVNFDDSWLADADSLTFFSTPSRRATNWLNSDTVGCERHHLVISPCHNHDIW